MKRIIFLFMIILTVSVCAYAKKNPWEQNLPIKEGVVTYEVTGTESGMQILYIKDYGNTTAEYRKTVKKIFGISRDPQETISIMTPDWVYSVNLLEKTAVKTVNPVKCMKEEFEKLSAADKKKAMENAEKLGMNSIQSLNGKVEKNAEVILGYSCDKVTAMGTSVYTVSGTGLELKSFSSIMGIKSSTVATEIKKQSVSSDIFEVPAGIEVEYHPESDDTVRQNAAFTVQSLVNGGVQVQAVPVEASDSEETRENGGAPTKEQVNEILKMFGGGQ